MVSGISWKSCFKKQDILNIKFEHALQLVSVVVSFWGSVSQRPVCGPFMVSQNS